MFNKLTRRVITHRIISEGFIHVIENWESRQLIIGYEKEFVPSINSIEILDTSMAYINRHGILPAFNTMLNRASNPQFNRVYIVAIDPPTMNHFIRYIDRAIFSILKDNSFLLEHAKQIITEDRHLGQPWYVSHEDSPSWSILTIKAILISPTFLLHEP